MGGSSGTDAISASSLFSGTGVLLVAARPEDELCVLPFACAFGVVHEIGVRYVRIDSGYESLDGGDE